MYTCVSLQVNIEPGFVQELLLAVLTLMFWHSGVYQLVTLQVGFQGKRLTTNVTPIWPCA